MRSTAQFGGVVTNSDDTDIVAVLFSKQRHRSGLHGVIHGCLEHLKVGVCKDLFVDGIFDVAKSGAGNGLEVREVESEPSGRDKGSLLLHVSAQSLAKRCVKEVGRRVVPHHIPAPVAVDLKLDALSNCDRALRDLAPVSNESTNRLLAIGDAKLSGSACDHAGVTDLSSRLRVKGGCLNQQLDFCTLLRRIGGLSIDENRQHATLCRGEVVAEKVGGLRVGQVEARPS